MKSFEILLCIATGQRDQALFNMNIDLMMFEADKVIPELLKQSRARYHLKPMVPLRYSDQEICVASHLEQYIENLRTFGKKVFINFV